MCTLPRIRVWHFLTSLLQPPPVTAPMLDRMKQKKNVCCDFILLLSTGVCSFETSSTIPLYATHSRQPGDHCKAPTHRRKVSVFALEQDLNLHEISSTRLCASARIKANFYQRSGSVLEHKHCSCSDTTFSSPPHRIAFKTRLQPPTAPMLFLQRPGRQSVEQSVTGAA